MSPGPSDRPSRIPVGTTEPISLAERSSSGGSVRARVYATLREGIARVELPPGLQLSEQQLAESLGVSRTPVREALVQLRDERLVDIVPHLGTFVSLISLRVLDDAQFIRLALECAAARAAAEAPVTADALAGLEQNLAAQKRARDTHDADAFFVLDEDLHHAICDLSGHQVWSTIQRSRVHVNRIRWLSFPMPSYISEGYAEHLEIVAGLAAEDPDAAEGALRNHLGRVPREVPRIREAHPDYFQG